VSETGISHGGNQGRKVLPIRANDPPLLVAAYTVWNRMIENRSLDVKRACSETGVPRWQFYEALKSEVVQAEVARQMEIMRTVESQLLKDNWFEIISHQIDIAAGRVGDARLATRAAQFLDGLRVHLEQQTGNSSQSGGKHPALALLERFGRSGGKVSARRTTVVEEVALACEEAARGAVIEGECAK